MEENIDACFDKLKENLSDTTDFRKCISKYRENKELIEITESKLLEQRGILMMHKTGEHSVEETAEEITEENFHTMSDLFNSKISELKKNIGAYTIEEKIEKYSEISRLGLQLKKYISKQKMEIVLI